MGTVEVHPQQTGQVLNLFDPKDDQLPILGESAMSKILILTNHSYMLYRFRTELIR